MYRPPRDPRTTRPADSVGWREILTGYGVVLAVPLVLFAISQPLVAAVLAASLVGAAVLGRRTLALARCYERCGGFSFEFGERVRITIAQPGIETSN
jgi:hypothetical protein